MSKNKFPGINIIETNWLKKGMGVCIPPFAILVYDGASTAVKQHEYGHFLQYQQMGFIRFYLKVGLPSLYSAAFFPKKHHLLKVEKDANKRAVHFFGENAPVANGMLWPRE